MNNERAERVRVGLIGAGGIARANHGPGIKLCPQAELSAACDPDPAARDRARDDLGIQAVYSDYEQFLDEAEVDAVVIATPNLLHAPITLKAVQRGRHVLCEKPLALSLEQAEGMYRAAEAAGVRHMTAFTYRFVPGMRYMRHLVKTGAIGVPHHFRATRFQDWGSRYLGWRQEKAAAGTGELGDMLSHRIDFAHDLIGPIRRLVAMQKQFLEDRIDRQGGHHASDVEDWVSILADFESGATGVFESTKLATGRGGAPGHDSCEVNGDEGTVIYHLHRPHEVQIGRPRGSLETVPVPEEFLKPPGAPRDPHQGDPVQGFRYDQSFEFVDAILNHRACCPSFYDGVRAQAVIDAAVLSDAEARWATPRYPKPS